jgi:hypothetical protein
MKYCKFKNFLNNIAEIKPGDGSITIKRQIMLFVGPQRLWNSAHATYDSPKLPIMK